MGAVVRKGTDTMPAEYRTMFTTLVTARVTTPRQLTVSTEASGTPRLPIFKGPRTI